METIRDILHKFEIVSDKKVNLAKSTLFFSPNTLRSQRQNLSNILGVRTVENMDNYQGLPLVIGKNKTNAFKYIINHFVNRIKGWSTMLMFKGEDFYKSCITIIAHLHVFDFLITQGTYFCYGG